MPNKGPRATRTPQDKPITLHVTPLQASEYQPTPRAVGRPKKNQMPAMPDLNMSENEREWFNFFITSNLDDNPDLTNADKILLQLAGVEYIKYLRVVAQELESGEVISMARQHPYTQMRGLLDQLSVTRKARKQTPDSQNTEARDQLRKFFG